MKTIRSDAAPRIGLISPCGWGNLGDAAIVTATIDGIRKRVPGAIFFGITSNPKDTEQRHHIKTFPLLSERVRSSYKSTVSAGLEKNTNSSVSLQQIGISILQWLRPLRFLASNCICLLKNVRNELRHAKSSYQVAKDADMLIISGGGQLDDYWGGAWVYPFTLYKWGILASLSKTPIVILSVGYGTNPSVLSRVFLRGILRISSYHSFRDMRTVSIAQELLGVNEPIFMPDLAFGLAVDERVPENEAKQETIKHRGIVGISPIAFADPRVWPIKDSKLYQNYLDVLAKFVDWLEEQGYSKIFICTDNMDVQCLRDLHDRCASASLYVESDVTRPEPYYKEVDELMAQLARTDLVVASRLHGVILSHRIAKPVLAISYDWKVDVHMAQVGEEEHVLDIRTLNTDALISKFQNLIGKLNDTKRNLREQSERYRQCLGDQYDLLVDRYLGEYEDVDPS